MRKTRAWTTRGPATISPSIRHSEVTCCPHRSEGTSRIRLPIDPFLADIRTRLAERGTLVLQAEPGSGKTTRVPAALLDDPTGAVLVSEPRRLAARAAARFVARERGARLGGDVGYQVRHDNRTSRATRLAFLTEGLLLRRILADPFLDGVRTVVLDEFHERSADADLVLAMLREIRETVRPDLRVLVMSATLDPAPLVAFLGAAHVAVPGRVHPVTTRWAERADGRELALRVRDAVRSALEETGGDVLVFLPGMLEIRQCQDRVARRDLLVVPLHGHLTPQEQDRAILPATQRKVILATNVAESSVTIEGVSAVVDSGLVRVLRHDPARGLDVLGLESVALDAAAQRRGRAGRTGPGLCLRLWTKGEERQMSPVTAPELARVDLTGPLLAARSFAGSGEFRWFERPAEGALATAAATLRLLDALDGDTVTATGRAMLDLPLQPRLARIVFAARELGCAFEAAGIAALLSEREILRGSVPDDSEDSGLLYRLELLGRARADVSRCRALGLDRGAVQAVLRAQDQIAGKARPSHRLAPPQLLAQALLAGFPDRVARRNAQRAEEASLVGGSVIRVAPGALPHGSQLFLALDLADRRRAGRGRSTVTLAMPLDLETLEATGRVDTEDEIDVDAAKGRVRATRRKRYLDLWVAEAPTGTPDRDTALPHLAALLRKDPWRWLGPQKDLRRTLARIEWLAGNTGAADLPRIDDAVIAELALDHCTGRGLGELAGIDLERAILARWPGLRARLARDAPDRLRLPSGRTARIDYAAEAGPTVAARLQEFFGTDDVPRLAGGRVAVVLELLAPNMRPVQVTRDLKSFWDSIYPKIRKELARRYRKHAWPENPRGSGD